ncbi:hypothetical protein KKD19_05765 [Patescibacteria group bacterium]|nr:hypothetical protein [Patescibacteria group bacterium]MBU4512711.1 hypothetical protein [Patescibacteria group bacterium]MCG2688430.1 hypothetical protein [Candidatus Parcubacteria bacterium]MCG2693172.1 hypothetical protein [Candidatus Parcubacteria bacterium]
MKVQVILAVPVFLMIAVVGELLFASQAYSGGLGEPSQQQLTPQAKVMTVSCKAFAFVDGARPREGAPKKTARSGPKTLRRSRVRTMAFVSICVPLGPASQQTPKKDFLKPVKAETPIACEEILPELILKLGGVHRVP